MIEAISWSLVVSPNMELPKELSRYDYNSVPNNMLSLRHVIDIYLYYLDYDVNAVIEVVVKILQENPLPDPLWSKDYDPSGMLMKQFQFDLKGITLKTNMHTDTIVRDSKAFRVDVLTKLL
jgi:hypothetical protein